MSVTRQAHIGLGKTLAASTNTHLQGKIAHFEDRDWDANPPTLLSSWIVEAVWVENASGSTLVASEICDWGSSEYFKEIGDNQAGADEIGAGVVDPWVGSGGVATGRYFWLIRKGPCKIINAGNGALTEGLMVKTGAAGRVDATNLADTDEIPEIFATIGRSMETIASTAGTKGRVFVNFH